ncbi:MAG: VWA containing CoxE family protein [Lachnospiraceae bacterium]|nr:VWA containing CoxE family protein [Lachnospiraceae bacterium]
MFIEFFYALRAGGLDVSQTEWLTLMEALDKGLCGASLTQFYYVSRMILVKSETEYDKFDRVFAAFFKNVSEDREQVSARIMKWLEQKTDCRVPTAEELEQLDQNLSQLKKEDSRQQTNDQISRMFEAKKKEQQTRHDGGNQWIGTGGTSPYGHSGKAPGGIRVGGRTGLMSAFAVISQERYRDFRLDKPLNYRQFQVAFRRLRQYSARLDVPKSELDVDKTVDETCNQGGYLSIEYRKPRKNTVKLLLLFDSGGTMIPFSTLCSNLFEAVDKANHFKDVKTYYFHNCIYSKLYKNPECENGDWVDTEWVFRNLDRDYRVIIVGDAQMAAEELLSPTGNYRGPNDGLSGYEWLTRFTKKYRRIVWLNPRKHEYAKGMDWMEAEVRIADLIPMYKLSVDGLNEAIKCLTRDQAPRKD